MPGQAAAVCRCPVAAAVLVDLAAAQRRSAADPAASVALFRCLAVPERRRRVVMWLWLVVPARPRGARRALLLALGLLVVTWLRVAALAVCRAADLCL